MMEESQFKFKRSINQWIELIAKKEAVFAISIPDLISDLKQILNLMISFPVLQLASRFPDLTHLFSLICGTSYLTAHIQVSRMLIRCIFYIALGPKGDHHLSEEVRAKKASESLNWALKQLKKLKNDRITLYLNKSNQSKLDNHLSQVSPEISMMASLGFSQTSISSSIILTLLQQLVNKLNKAEALFQRIIAASPDNQVDNENLKKLSSPILAYRQVIRSVSRSCIALIDNGFIAIPLVEKLISSQVIHKTTNETSIDEISSTKPDTNMECCCDLSNEFVDKLYSSRTFMDRLSIDSKAVLLCKCPRAFNNEISRLIRAIISRPLANTRQIMNWTQPLCQACLRSPAIWVHFSDILCRLIIESCHPSICTLYSITWQQISKLYNEKPKLYQLNCPISLFWNSSITQIVDILQNNSEHQRQYLLLNSAIESITEHRSDSMMIDGQNTDNQQATPQIWFSLTAFHSWIDKAYLELCLSSSSSIPFERKAQKDEYAKLIAFHAHPGNIDLRNTTAARLVHKSEEIMKFLELKNSNIGDSLAYLEIIFNQEKCIHRLLLSSLSVHFNRTLALSVITTLSKYSAFSLSEILSWLDVLCDQVEQPTHFPNYGDLNAPAIATMVVELGIYQKKMTPIDLNERLQSIVQRISTKLEPRVLEETLESFT